MTFNFADAGMFKPPQEEGAEKGQKDKKKHHRFHLHKHKHKGDSVDETKAAHGSQTGESLHSDSRQTDGSASQQTSGVRSSPRSQCPYPVNFMHWHMADIWLIRHHSLVEAFL